jgi:tRNA dimethylallyltransferase
MVDATTQPDPLLVIAGPTASGKTRLAVEVAEALSAEVVSADAFAVYRGLDIGTDKPDADTRRRVRHHLVDVVDPDQRFSAGDFVTAANGAIADIRSSGRLPIVAGGTHFYIRALIMGLFPSPAHDPSVRAQLEDLWRDDPAEAYQMLRSVDPEAALKISARDRQRVLRALEVFRLTGEPISQHWAHHRETPHFRPFLAAPRRPRAELYARIDSRVDSMFSCGLEEEVQRILASGVPRNAHALKAIGYRQVCAMLDGDIDRATAIELTKRASRRFAKRQLTWLRSLREGSLIWVEPAEHGGTETVISRWTQHVREGWAS